MAAALIRADRDAANLHTPAILVVGDVTALGRDLPGDTPAFADLDALLHGTLVT